MLCLGSRAANSALCTAAAPPNHASNHAAAPPLTDAHKAVAAIVCLAGAGVAANGVGAGGVLAALGPGPIGFALVDVCSAGEATNMRAVYTMCVHVCVGGIYIGVASLRLLSNLSCFRLT